MDEERPLRSAKDEKTADAIKGYMRFFDRYSAVEAQIKRAAAAEDEKEAFRKSTQEYGHVRIAKNEEGSKYLWNMTDLTLIVVKLKNY